MRVRTLIFRIFLAIILISIAIPLLWLCLSWFTPEVILYQANRIANGRPYCIVVPDEYNQFSKYHEAVNRGDLEYSALTTHLLWGGSGASDGMAENYYSLLILQNPDEIRNWSKFYLNFERDVNPLQMSLVHVDFRRLCTPIVGFAKAVR
jgi:hypothetical protein